MVARPKRQGKHRELPQGHKLRSDGMVTLTEGRVTGTAHGLGCEAVTGYTPHEFEQDGGLWYLMILEPDRPAVLAQAESARATARN